MPRGTDETRCRMSESHKGQNVGMKRGPLSDELKKRLSELHKGKLPWNTGKNIGPISGKHHSEETKRKLREKALTYALKYGRTQMGHNEKQELDAAEVRDGVTIDRNFKVIGYKPDGYCHSTNTVYEVYEKHHFRPKFIDKDSIRQKRIVNELKCNFTIIADGVVIENEYQGVSV